jgi:hypothetical protein
MMASMIKSCLTFITFLLQGIFTLRRVKAGKSKFRESNSPAFTVAVLRVFLYFTGFNWTKGGWVPAQ